MIQTRRVTFHSAYQCQNLGIEYGCHRHVEVLHIPQRSSNISPILTRPSPLPGIRCRHIIPHMCPRSTQSARQNARTLGETGATDAAPESSHTPYAPVAGHWPWQWDLMDRSHVTGIRRVARIPSIRVYDQGARASSAPVRSPKPEADASLERGFGRDKPPATHREEPVRSGRFTELFATFLSFDCFRRFLRCTASTFNVQ